MNLTCSPPNDYVCANTALCLLQKGFVVGFWGSDGFLIFISCDYRDSSSLAARQHTKC